MRTREVLALHGQPGSGRCFAGVAAFLGTGFVLRIPDRPGWGTSSERPRGLPDQASWAAGLVSGPTVLVGYSFGAAVAVLAAGEVPERVAGLVLVAPAVGREALVWVDRLLGLDGVGHLGGALIAGFAERSLAALVAPRARAAFLVEQRSLLDHLGEVETALGRLSVPITVVAARRDRVVPARAILALRARVPSAELVVVPGGHDVLLRWPAVVADAVRTLWRRTS